MYKIKFFFNLMFQNWGAHYRPRIFMGAFNRSNTVDLIKVDNFHFKHFSIQDH